MPPIQASILADAISALTNNDNDAELSRKLFPIFNSFEAVTEKTLHLILMNVFEKLDDEMRLDVELDMDLHIKRKRKEARLSKN